MLEEEIQEQPFSYINATLINASGKKKHRRKGRGIVGRSWTLKWVDCGNGSEEMRRNK